MTDPDGVTRWYTADPRGILPLDCLHVPRTLRQIVRQNRFEVRFNHNFADVMAACMRVRRRGANGSWISDELLRAYFQLHRMGHAHSVECWKDGKLAGGLYGVSLGGAFFGESMFHLERDASKVALVHLVSRLNERGFVLLDTQAVTSHLSRFGCIEIPAERYFEMLDSAVEKKCRFED